MKQIICLLVSILLCISLAGCKSKEEKAVEAGYKLACEECDFERLTTENGLDMVHIQGKVILVGESSLGKGFMLDMTNNPNKIFSVEVNYDGEDIKENDTVEVWGSILSYRMVNKDGSEELDILNDEYVTIPNIEAKFIKKI